MARLTTLLCVLALAAPAAALAQDNPFGPIPPAPPQQTAPPEDDTTNPAADDGLSETQQLLIGLAGITLLLGIAIAIIRDARSAAPAEHHLTEDEGGTKSRGSRTPKEQRVKRGRAKAKQARRARKRNR